MRWSWPSIHKALGFTLSTGGENRVTGKPGGQRERPEVTLELCGKSVKSSHEGAGGGKAWGPRKRLSHGLMALSG